MKKSLLLGTIVAVLGYIICFQLARSQGVAAAMSFAAMLVVGVVVVYSNLILMAIRQMK